MGMQNSTACEQVHTNDSNAAHKYLYAHHIVQIMRKSINYACAVKNDTPIMCTVGLSADGISPKSGDEVIKYK